MTKIFLALDTNVRHEAIKLLEQTLRHLDGIKIGPLLYSRGGMEIVRDLSEYCGSLCPIFLDLKLHDAPSIVRKTAFTVTHWHPLAKIKYLTVHALGGSEMIREAVHGADDKTSIIAVTILTSLSFMDLKELGFAHATQTQVLRLTEIALKSGAKGVVCSFFECEAVKKQFGSDCLIICPGALTGPDDPNHSRGDISLSPYRDYVDILVSGRRISESKDPESALKQLRKEVS